MHGSLLQRSQHMMDVDASTTVDMTVLPLAVREAAFFESADCYTAMIANKEVSPAPFMAPLCCCHEQLSHPCMRILPDLVLRLAVMGLLLILSRVHAHTSLLPAVTVMHEPLDQ